MSARCCWCWPWSARAGVCRAANAACPASPARSSDKRLAIVETLMMGPRQRLFIVRRDNVEHLVLSGPEGACLIENIPHSAAGLRIASAPRIHPMKRLLSLSRCWFWRWRCWRPALPSPATPDAAAAAAATRRQWRAFHRSQRQRPFHRPHGADHRPDHGAVDRAFDPDHDDQLCAHRGGAVAAAHRAGPAAKPAQQRDGVAGDVPHLVRDDARPSPTPITRASSR